MGAPSSHLQHPGLSGISEVLAYTRLGQKLEKSGLFLRARGIGITWACVGERA